MSVLLPAASALRSRWAKDGSLPPASWPETKVTVCETSRWVSGICKLAAAAMPAVTPGTISMAMPSARSASSSSPPRPNTKGSPPFKRTTVWPAADQKDAPLRRAGLGGLVDGLADQGAGFGLIAFQHGLGGGAFEHALPEMAARGACRQCFGDAAAILAGELGQGIEPRVQLLLEPRAQALGQHGGCRRRADGHGDLAAIDDGRKREAAKLRTVRHVDRHAKRPGNGRDARVFFIVLGGGDDEGTAPQLIDARLWCDAHDLAGAFELRKLRNELLCRDLNNHRALQKKPRLDGRKLSAAHDERGFALEAHEDGEGAHQRAPPTATGSAGASVKLSGASSTSSPSSSGVMMIWQESLERSSTWKAPSSISDSSSVGGTSLPTQALPTQTWQVAQAHAPPHSALMGRPQSRITSITRQPSSASRR